MASFMEWNDSLARHFFRPDAAGQPVWLYVTDDLIEELGHGMGSGVADLVAAVETGPSWATATGLCQRALQASEGWRRRGLAYPPYIAYLAVFVLAAGIEGDFARHAYYPRLRALLGEPGEGALPSFHRMLELWDDLERWSSHDLQGSIGLFEARIVGGHIHVGLPIAQTILSEDERLALPMMFADAGLDPTSPSPDDELARMLRAHVKELRPRTRELVRTKNDPESYAVLLDVVGEELGRWDGIYVEIEEGQSAGHERRLANLRLCLTLDRVAGRLASTLRCRIRNEIPEEGLHLRGAGLPPLKCEDSGLPGWSTPIEDERLGGQFEASVIDWSDGVSMTEANLGWRFSLPGRRIRIFVSGQTSGLPGLIEVRQVPRGQQVYFLYRASDSSALADWSQRECREFQEISIREGMPAGWALAHCSEVLGDSLVRTRFPELALSERVRIELVGGVRSKGAMTYFPFAPPSVLLEGGDGRETLNCNGQPLAMAGSARSYALPEGLPLESRLTIDATREGQPVKRVSIYLSGEFDWKRTGQTPITGPWGEAWAPGDVAASGALTVGARPAVEAFHKSLALALGVDQNAPETFCIGRVPGQVFSFRGRFASPSWTPIWAVPMGQHGRSIYCGADIEADAPDISRRGGSSDDIRLWKEILWHRRKRITPPATAVLTRLWRKYVDEARRVPDR